MNLNASLDFCPKRTAVMVAERGWGNAEVFSRPLNRSVKSELKDEDGFLSVTRRNRPPARNARNNPSGDVKMHASERNAVQRKSRDGKMGAGVIPQKKQDRTENRFESLINDLEEAGAMVLENLSELARVEVAACKTPIRKETVLLEQEDYFVPHLFREPRITKLDKLRYLELTAMGVQLLNHLKAYANDTRRALLCGTEVPGFRRAKSHQRQLAYNNKPGFRGKRNGNRLTSKVFSQDPTVASSCRNLHEAVNNPGWTDISNAYRKSVAWKFTRRSNGKSRTDQSSKKGFVGNASSDLHQKVQGAPRRFQAAHLEPRSC